MTKLIRNYSILIVDDELNLREGSKRILKRQGYDVDIAVNGKEALSIMDIRAFDIVLLDLKMPGMDGIEVLERIGEKHPDTLVVIVTGFATIETAIDAMKKGAYDFMTKPFRPEQLRLAVSRAIEHIQLIEERDLLEAERERGLWAITTEKSRLKTVVNGIVAGILILEPSKRIVMINPAFNRMLKVDGEKLPGTYLQDHEELVGLDGIIEDILENGHGPSGDFTREMQVPGDRITYLRVTVNFIVSENETRQGMLAVVRDITYFKELEKEKQAFVAMLTHELRSPLGAVDTQLHVILKGLAGELTEKQSSMLGRMRNRIGNVLAMINDLLDLSKIEARQFVREKVLTDINPVVRDSVELLTAQAQTREQSLEMHLAEALPMVLGDAHTLKEVVVNLVSNAIRYTPKGGRIEAATRIEDGHVVISISDDGLGIAPEYRDKIFDRFFRVKDERARDVVGTGLGLPIVKAIVEDHSGTISVDSQIGQGSTFTVRLPVYTDAEDS